MYLIVDYALWTCVYYCFDGRQLRTCKKLMSNWILINSLLGSLISLRNGSVLGTNILISIFKWIRNENSEFNINCAVDQTLRQSLIPLFFVCFIGLKISWGLTSLGPEFFDKIFLDLKCLEPKILIFLDSDVLDPIFFDLQYSLGLERGKMLLNKIVLGQHFSLLRISYPICGNCSSLVKCWGTQPRVSCYW